jgi:hypothetical protein
VANEVSVGSAFVKPGTFDYSDLADLAPAAFIASPSSRRWRTCACRAWSRCPA